jgi:hypothetical protein
MKKRRFIPSQYFTKVELKQKCLSEVVCTDHPLSCYNYFFILPAFSKFFFTLNLTILVISSAGNGLSNGN